MVKNAEWFVLSVLKAFFFPWWGETFLREFSRNVHSTQKVCLNKVYLQVWKYLPSFNVHSSTVNICDIINGIIYLIFLKKFIRFEDNIIFNVLLTEPNKMYSQLTVSCVLVNTFYQNDDTWSPLLFRRSREVGVVRRGSYTWLKKWAPSSLSLSQPCIWSSSDHAYFWWSSEQKRWSSTIILMKCVD